MFKNEPTRCDMLCCCHHVFTSGFTPFLIILISLLIIVKMSNIFLMANILNKESNNYPTLHMQVIDCKVALHCLIFANYYCKYFAALVSSK